ncbi:hypothetical protein CEXT_315441 [Caerostris extrusa]|uniref:Uncharacterized protein n=1 Tax=Caerostris extrusa TaxID=172846 RepID=A0AAV4QHK4_CAEEX|nr:hypothetical protein CEXT_315441 [Caerostris extrusa]
MNFRYEPSIQLTLNKSQLSSIAEEQKANSQLTPLAPEIIQFSIRESSVYIRSQSFSGYKVSKASYARDLKTKSFVELLRTGWSRPAQSRGGGSNYFRCRTGKESLQLFQPPSLAIGWAPPGMPRPSPATCGIGFHDDGVQTTLRKEAAKRFSPIIPSLHKNLQPPWMQAGDAGEAISKTRRGRPVFPRCTHARNKPSAPGTRGIVFMLTEDLFITTAVVRPNVDSEFANPLLLYRELFYIYAIIVY